MILQCDQLSSEWFQAHCGMVTGSHAKNVLDFTKERILKSGEKRGGEEGASRALYRHIKAAELLTKVVVQNNYVSYEMREGIEKEPEARRHYALEEGVFVEQVGFVISDTVTRMGCSPDGLVGDHGILGIKCPKPSTHVRWMLEGVIPEEHIPQARLELACMPEREWFDFRSFCPEAPDAWKGFTIRLMRKDAEIDAMIEAVNKFTAEVDAMMARLYVIAGQRIEPAPRKSKFVEQLEGSLTEEDISWAIAQERGNA